LLEFLDCSLCGDQEAFKSEATARSALNTAGWWCGGTAILHCGGNSFRVFLTQRLLKSKGGDCSQGCKTGGSLHPGPYVREQSTQPTGEGTSADCQ